MVLVLNSSIFSFFHVSTSSVIFSELSPVLLKLLCQRKGCVKGVGKGNVEKRMGMFFRGDFGILCTFIWIFNVNSIAVAWKVDSANNGFFFWGGGGALFFKLQFFRHVSNYIFFKEYFVLAWTVTIQMKTLMWCFMFIFLVFLKLVWSLRQHNWCCERI